MLNLKSVSLTSLLLALLAGCNSTPPASTTPAVDVAAEQAKLRDLEAAWVKEVAAKDLDKIVAHYTDDAVFMGPGAPAAKGKEGVRAGWKGMLNDLQNMDFSADRIEISQSGDMATTQGSYAMTIMDSKTRKPVDDKGSYVTVYKKQADGNWKSIEDIAVSEVVH